jgi:hypothetical protein
MVGHIDRGVNAVKEDEVAFNPFTHGEIFDVDMLCLWCRFLCIAHSSASIVVFVKESSSFLGNVEVLEYAPDKRYHLTSVVRGHKFSFGR